MRRIGIWCVEQRSAPGRNVRVGEGRLAMRDDKILTFATEAEAQAEVDALRAKHGVFAGGNWLFFTMPLAEPQEEITK